MPASAPERRLQRAETQCAMLLPAQGSPSCPELGPWLREARCAALYPSPTHQGIWGKVQGAEVREHSSGRQHSWKHPSRTPFPVPVCKAEQVCKGEALHCALPAPSDSSSPQEAGWGGGRGEGHQRQPSFLHGWDLSEPLLGAGRGTSPGTHPRSPLRRLPGPPPPFFLPLWLNFLSKLSAGAQRLSLRPAHWLPCTGARSFLSPEPALALWFPRPFALN